MYKIHLENFDGICFTLPFFKEVNHTIGKTMVRTSHPRQLPSVGVASHKIGNDLVRRLPWRDGQVPPMTGWDESDESVYFQPTPPWN